MESADYIVTDGTFYRLKPKAFADKLNGLGMALHSCHIGFELDTAEKVFADAAETGTKYVIYSYLPGGMRQNIDGYKTTAEKFNKMGEIGNKYGVCFAYHNHAFEFDSME